MACSKQTYTALATWTPSQVADLFRDAFIDAGLMTDWHASFVSSGIENRVIELTYDGSKTYGKTYYWFKFNTGGAFLQFATGWNTSTNQPTGTQYLDYLSTSATSTTSHWTMVNWGTASTVTLTRYTSGVDSEQSWFVLQQSTTRRIFTITHPSSPLQSWLNLDRGFYAGFLHVNPSTSSGLGQIRFNRGPALRRDLLLGPALNGNSTQEYFNSNAAGQMYLGYVAVGHVSNSTNNYAVSGPYIYLPVGFSESNPAYPADSSPVFHSMPATPYTTASLPSDFGITFHYATNSISTEDTFVVSAGVEEWEVLAFSANSTVVNGASPLFLARMI